MQTTLILTLSTFFLVAVTARESGSCLTKSLVRESPLDFRSSYAEIQTGVCLFCAQDRFTAFASGDCCGKSGQRIGTDSEAAEAASVVAGALLDYLAVQGHFWENDKEALDAFTHLVRYMPVRDSVQLFAGDDRFLDFLVSHVRLALHVRSEGPAWSRNGSVPDAIWFDYVLPYSLIDEKRDVAWQWRKRFLKLFLPLANNASNATAAMHALSAAIPHAAAGGVLQLPLGVDVAGSVFRWKSETSPMRLSPEQVVSLELSESKP